MFARITRRLSNIYAMLMLRGMTTCARRLFHFVDVVDDDGSVGGVVFTNDLELLARVSEYNAGYPSAYELGFERGLSETQNDSYFTGWCDGVEFFESLPENRSRADEVYQAYSDGYELGYFDGYEVGENEGYDLGWTEGREYVDFDRAYLDAYHEGYADGQTVGLDEDERYSIGFNDGSVDGFERGKEYAATLLRPDEERQTEKRSQPTTAFTMDDIEDDRIPIGLND